MYQRWAQDTSQAESALVTQLSSWCLGRWCSDGSNHVPRGPSGAVLSGLGVSALWLRVTQTHLWKWLVGALVGDIMGNGMRGGENLSQAGTRQWWTRQWFL